MSVKKTSQILKLKLKKSKLAIIDIGSSSVRLVVFSEPNFSTNIIFNEKVTLELGSEMFKKVIEDNKVKSLLKVLRRFFQICKKIKKFKFEVFKCPYRKSNLRLKTI